MRTASTVVGLLVAVAAGAAEPMPLFNGVDLEGLDVYVEGAAPAEAWSITDGVLRATAKGRGYVSTKRAHADYVLRLEWRWPEGDADGQANSGVLLHIVGPDELWPKGFEVQLKSGAAGDLFSFEDARSADETVSRNPNGVSTGRLPSTERGHEKPAGEWNTCEITARGDEVVVKVNGVEVNRMTGLIPSAGHIGLQSEGYVIEFRNVTVEPLPPAKDLHAPLPR